MRRLLRPIVLSLLAALAPAALLAQGSGGAAEPPFPLHEGDFPTAPVELDGTPLFRVRGSAAFSAERRAAAIEGRLRDAAGDSALQLDKLEMVETELGILIQMGSRKIIYVLEADARIEGLSTRELAMGYLETMRQAIASYRAERTRASLLGAASRAGAMTAAFAISLALLLPLFRRIDRRVQRRFSRSARELEARSFEIVRAERLEAALRGTLRSARAVMVAVLGFVYLDQMLALFPWTRFASNRLTAWVAGPLLSLGHAFVADIPDLIFLAVLGVLLRYGLKLLHLFFGGIARGSIVIEGFDADWAWPTYKIARGAAVAFTLVVAYPYIPGSGSDAFKGVSLFAGVVLSLGSSSVISNVIAGYSMTYRRAFRVGDRVKIGNVVGDVAEVRLQVTSIHTPKNEEVVVPNATILNTEVVNYTRLAAERGLILHTSVGIGYEVPWRQVEAMLLLAAERTPGLLREPKAFVLQKSLGDFAVNYELNVYCSDARQMFPLNSELHRNVQDVFNEYGVQIMTPSYEADPSEPKLVPKGQWYAAPAAPPAPADSPGERAL